MVVARRDRITRGFAIWSISFLAILPEQPDGMEKRFKTPPAWFEWPEGHH
jgi:hypothetical protein